MDIDNKTDKEVVYTASSGGPAIRPGLLRQIYLWIRSLWRLLGVRFFGFRPKVCGGYYCWGMLEQGEAGHHVQEADEWDSVGITAIVFGGFWPSFPSARFETPPGKITVERDDEHGGYRIIKRCDRS